MSVGGTAAMLALKQDMLDMKELGHRVEKINPRREPVHPNPVYQVQLANADAYGPTNADMFGLYRWEETILARTNILPRIPVEMSDEVYYSNPEFDPVSECFMIRAYASTLE